MPTGDEFQVTAIVVNFNSGEFLAGCVDSLLAQDLGVDVIVVDSASPTDQASHLDGVRSRGGRVIELEENVGYAGACNRGLAEARGSFVVFANADVVARPGALRSSIDHLEANSDVGLVEPRTFLDDDRTFRIPEFFSLTPREIVAEALARSSSSLADRLSVARLRRTLPGWRAVTPRAQTALTGAFLIGRRDVIERFGGFDAAFPLAYEDWDLFARMSGRGLDVVLVPEAEVIHYAHRSRITVLDETFAKSRAGRRRFIQRHLGVLGGALDAVCGFASSCSNRIHKPKPVTRFTELGALTEPPRLELTGSAGPYVLELAMDPFFHLTAGHFGEGDTFAFSDAAWRALLPTTYFVRALCPESFARRGAWSFLRR